jgi:hypothetical protein
VRRTHKSRHGGPLNGGHSDLTDEYRRVLIIKALTECGQEVTPAAIDKQFKYETGRKWKTGK